MLLFSLKTTISVLGSNTLLEMHELYCITTWIQYSLNMIKECCPVCGRTQTLHNRSVFYKLKIKCWETAKKLVCKCKGNRERSSVSGVYLSKCPTAYNRYTSCRESGMSSADTLQARVALSKLSTLHSRSQSLCKM